MSAALIKSRAEVEIEVGRRVYVSPHPFADPEEVWVSADLTLDQAINDIFPADTLAEKVDVRFDGEVVPRDSAWPPARARIEMTIRPGSKGLLRTLIQAVVIFATVVIVALLTWNPMLALQAGFSVGAVMGNLLANAIIPPVLPEGPPPAKTLYSLTGARNSVRIGQPMPIVLGTRRVVADIMVPFYQEVVGEDIYIRGAVCWGLGDYQISNLKNGDTLLSSYAGVQIQHSLKRTDPTPTLIPGLVAGQAVGVNFTNTSWATRTTSPDAEEIEIIVAFPKGLGWLKDGQKKKAWTVTLEVKYKESGSSNERTITAATTEEADAVARSLGSATRRDLYGDLGAGFIDDFHNQLGSGGSVQLTRSFTRSAPGEAFFASFKFAVPPGKQYDVSVRRQTALQGDNEHFEDVSWTVMNTWKGGNPFPNPLAAVTALRVKATDQLSGQLDQINAIVSNLLRTYTPPAGGASAASSADFSGSAVSSNPADQLLHIALGPHQVRPTPDAEINWPAFAAFWEWCDAQGFTFDFYETSGRRKGDLEQLCCGAGRAKILRIDGRLTPIIDRAQPAGARTILSPDNARDFKFSKIFPPDVHALRVRFFNKDTDYRDDERIIYLNGQTAATATKFEKFDMPGVVDKDLIFRHARYAFKSAKLQTLSGTCTQDIEGSLLLRYGDRIAIRHSTVQITGESGWIERVDFNNNGQITGFRLSEKARLENGKTYVFRWREITTDANGDAVVTAAHLENLAFSTAVAASIETDSFSFASPLTAGTLKPGQLGVVGELGSETIDALVKGIRPVDDRGQMFQIDWVEYAEARFVEDTIPPHTPLTPPALDARPNGVVLGQATTTPDHILIGFDLAQVSGVDVIGFEVWYRETPPAGADAPWLPLPRLPAEARSLALPVARAGQSFDVRVITLGRGDVRSDPVIGTGYAAATDVVAPTNPVVTPVGRSLGGGAGTVPVLSVSVDPPEDPALTSHLLVEVSETGNNSWRMATTMPSDNPVKDVTGLAPGQAYDVRLAWVNARGAVTPVAQRPLISNVTVGSLISDNTANVGTIAGTTVASELQALVSGSREVGDVIISGVGSLKSVLSTQNTNINQALKDSGTASGGLGLEVDHASVLALVNNGAQGTTVAVTVTVTGGIAPYSYAWSHVSGDTGVVVDSPSAATTTFTATPGLNATKSAIKRCTVTDSTSGTALTKSIDVTATVTDNTNFGGGGGGLNP